MQEDKRDMIVRPAEPSRIYRSIFLADGWAHQKYFGWRVIADMPGLRVLTKRRAIFDRYLILLTKGGEAPLTGWVTRAAGKFGLSNIVVHDFDRLIVGVPIIAGRLFKVA